MITSFSWPCGLGLSGMREGGPAYRILSTTAVSPSIWNHSKSSALFFSCCSVKLMDCSRAFHRSDFLVDWEPEGCAGTAWPAKAKRRMAGNSLKDLSPLFIGKLLRQGCLGNLKMARNALNSLLFERLKVG